MSDEFGIASRIEWEVPYMLAALRCAKRSLSLGQVTRLKLRNVAQRTYGDPGVRDSICDLSQKGHRIRVGDFGAV